MMVPIITKKKNTQSIAKSSFHCNKSTQENNAHFPRHTQHQQKHSRKEFVCRTQNKENAFKEGIYVQIKEQKDVASKEVNCVQQNTEQDKKKLCVQNKEQTYA
jgi:hypothetical protein